MEKEVRENGFKKVSLRKAVEDKKDYWNRCINNFPSDSEYTQSWWATEQIRFFLERNQLEDVLLDEEDLKTLLSVRMVVSEELSWVMDPTAIEQVKQGILLRVNAQMLRKIMEMGK